MRAACSDDDLAASSLAKLEDRAALLRQGGATEAFAGTWRGQIPTPENYEGEVRGDDVEVVLELSANGRGNLTVGQGAELPSPTDASAGYPPAAQRHPEGASLVRFHGGFPYSVYSPQVSNEASLEFFISLEELYGGWCSLQTPNAHLDDCAYEILPEHEGMRSSDLGCSLLTDAGAQEVDCVRHGLYSEFVCLCDASHCGFNPTPINAQLSLDATGTVLTGVVQRLGVDSIQLVSEPKGD